MLKKIFCFVFITLLCSCSGPYYAMRSNYDVKDANKVLLMQRSLRDDIEVVRLTHGQLENGVFFVEAQLKSSSRSSLPFQYKVKYYGSDYREIEETNWKPHVLRPNDIITIKENSISADKVTDYVIHISKQVQK